MVEHLVRCAIDPRTAAQYLALQQQRRLNPCEREAFWTAVLGPREYGGSRRGAGGRSGAKAGARSGSGTGSGTEREESEKMCEEEELDHEEEAGGGGSQPRADPEVKEEEQEEQEEGASGCTRPLIRTRGRTFQRKSSSCFQGKLSTCHSHSSCRAMTALLNESRCCASIMWHPLVPHASTSTSSSCVQASWSSSPEGRTSRTSPQRPSGSIGLLKWT